MHRLFLILFAVMIFLVPATLPAAEPVPSAAPAAAPVPVAPEKATKAGDPMVNFTLSDVDGKMVSISDLVQKKYTVVVYAQSACSACRAEADQVIELVQKKDHVSLVYIMVDYTGMKGAKYFLEEFNVSKYAKVLLDPKFESGPKYSITSTPATLILDKDKKVYGIYPGFNPNGDALLKVISGL